MQAHPQHPSFPVSCLPSSLRAMLIAALCSHFLLSDGDLAIFNTENQWNCRSSLSCAPFSTAWLAAGAPPAGQRGGKGPPHAPRLPPPGAEDPSPCALLSPAAAAAPRQGGANSLFSLCVPCRCVRGLSSQRRLPEQRGQFAEAPSWRHFHPAAAGSFRSSF